MCEALFAGAAVAFPEFNESGDLPPGVHPATLTDVLGRFGHGSAQRQVAAGRLTRLHELATSTGYLARFVVFGSFVTAKADPRDVDVVLIMADEFDVAVVTGDAATVFRHADAGAQLGASVFWATRSGAFGGDQAMVEFWQVRRAGGLRGIIEITPGAP